MLQRWRPGAPLALRVLGVVAIFAVLQGVGMGLWSSRQLDAQQPSQAIVVATTLFEAPLESAGPGPAALSVGTISLAPGQATLPLEGPGSLLILVESGHVTLLTDRAIDGLAPVNQAGDAGEADLVYHLRAGQRVTIPSIGTVQFRNEGDEPSNLMLLTLVPEGG